MINFFISGINHQISMISDFFKNALLSKSSHMSTNISTILNYIDINYYDILDLNKIKVKNENMKTHTSWAMSVQGMSFIAAILLLNLDEADAFIVFANLVNRPLLAAFYRVIRIF